ncbi:MAG: phosphatase PAP2 family protein [Deltaproteobacteria bacterium]|nr:phosphatase PAP2 family protein [Deltaproteobacteria bacterium]
MRPNYVLWTGLWVIAVSITLAAHYFPYFPGDVAVDRWVQSLVPRDLGWAQGVSRAVDFPWILLIAALIFALSWVLAGWRGAVLSIVSLAGMLTLGYWLSPVVARPRPSLELVRVFRPLSGYSFPSISALCYAATFGFLAILAAVKSSGRLRLALMIGCSVLLVLCWAARIALGAHWPSDVLISYYLGLLWSACLIRFALRSDQPLAGGSSSKAGN